MSSYFKFLSSVLSYQFGYITLRTYSVIHKSFIIIAEVAFCIFPTFLDSSSVFTATFSDCHNDLPSSFLSFFLAFHFLNRSSQKWYTYYQRVVEFARDGWMSFGLHCFGLQRLWMLVRSWRLGKTGRRNRRVSRVFRKGFERPKWFVNL